MINQIKLNWKCKRIFVHLLWISEILISSEGNMCIFMSASIIIFISVKHGLKCWPFHHTCCRFSLYQTPQDKNLLFQITGIWDKRRQRVKKTEGSNISNTTKTSVWQKQYFELSEFETMYLKYSLQKRQHFLFIVL